MSDTPYSPDELISFYLDGEAAAAEVARVEGDPDLRARADEMRAAIESTATPITIPTLDLDRIRAVAVTASTTTPVVSDLAATAAVRQARIQRRNRLVSVAAVFVFLALGISVIRSIGTSTDNDTSAVAAGDDSAADSAPSDFESSSNDAGSGGATIDEAEIAQADLATEEAASEATPAEDGELDILPAALEPVATVAELEEAVGGLVTGADARFAATGADSVDGAGQQDLLTGLCPLLVDELLASQPSGLVSVETALVRVDGFAAVVALGLGPDGKVTGFVVLDEGCQAVEQLTFSAG